MKTNFWELIRDANGNQHWVSNGERWLVVVQHSENRPVHIHEAADEAAARAMTERAKAAHARDSSLYNRIEMHEATLVASVKAAHNFGYNGNVGRAKSFSSQRREDRERAQAEGLVLEDHIDGGRKALKSWKLTNVDNWRAEILDDNWVYAFLTGTRSFEEAYHVNSALHFGTVQPKNP